MRLIKEGDFESIAGLKLQGLLYYQASQFWREPGKDFGSQKGTN
jgi:hypothetical protein